jgi:hypothetical protein
MSLHQHMGNAVGLGLQVAVGPHQTAGGTDAHAVAPAPVDGAVQQLGGAVELCGKLQAGCIQQELGPLFGRRQVVGGKGVDVSGVHGGLPVL